MEWTVILSGWSYSTYDVATILLFPFMEHVWIFNLEPWDLSAGDLSIIIKLKTWS